MKVTVEVSDHTEMTHAPYWLLIDPKGKSIFERVVGLFFSREEADKHLEMNRPYYSEAAQVYCFSGYRGHTYREAYEEAWNLSKSKE